MIIRRLYIGCQLIMIETEAEDNLNESDLRMK